MIASTEGGGGVNWLEGKLCFVITLPRLPYTEPHPGLFYTIELALISEIDPASVSTTTSREPSDTPSTYFNTCHLCEKLFC